jgi:hypothetical protein
MSANSVAPSEYSRIERWAVHREHLGSVKAMVPVKNTVEVSVAAGDPGIPMSSAGVRRFH